MDSSCAKMSYVHNCLFALCNDYTLIDEELGLEWRTPNFKLRYVITLRDV